MARAHLTNGSSAATFLRRRQRLLATSGALALVLGIWWPREGTAGTNLEVALSRLLHKRGLHVNPDRIAWLGKRADGGTPLAFFSARLSRTGEGTEAHTDLWYARVHTDGRQVIHDLDEPVNLTRTSSASEEAPVVAGPYVLYASTVAGRYDAVTVLDVSGESSALTEGWPWYARVQNAITNYQDTGRVRGLARRRYGLKHPVRSLSIRALATKNSEPRFEILADGGRILLDPRRKTPRAGAEHVEVRPTAKGQPGTITWVVDTVRKIPWVGSEPIEWLEHAVFGVVDRWDRAWYAAFGGNAQEEAAEAHRDLGVSEPEQRRRLELSVTNPEMGWPPPRLRPILRPALRGEGRWIAVVDDPFVASYPNAPPAFYQTYLRPDEERGYARVYITLWDPRQVQLRIMTGTREPESATGETGPGMVPRDPRILRRLVGGFNGGFQALHGEFGMMSEGRVYLPPKPWAATVAVFQDGRVALGSWTDPPEGVEEYSERWAVEQVPSDMVEFRQNLTTLVEGNRYNPWERWWWGAAPAQAEEQTFIDRTGLCLTKRGFLAYFYGKSLGPEALGRVMLRARCVRGMHLDMNNRHTGFEFYDVRPTGEHPPLERRLVSSEHEGDVPRARGWTARARKMVRRMNPIRFPRYIDRDGRDFFYLTLRPVLPGPALQAQNEFSSAGLPHAGWPPAFARTAVGQKEGARTWFVRIDPGRATPAPLAPAASRRVLAYLSNAKPMRRSGPSSFGLYAVSEVVGRQWRVGIAPSEAHVVLSGRSVQERPRSSAAVAVDAEGFLLYVEQQPGDRVALGERLAAAGIPGAQALALPRDVRLAFVVDGIAVAPDSYERPVPDARDALGFIADERPAAQVLFPEVAPRPYQAWAKLQDTRVRYFREGEPTFRLTDGEVERLDRNPE